MSSHFQDIKPRIGKYKITSPLKITETDLFDVGGYLVLRFFEHNDVSDLKADKA